MDFKSMIITGFEQFLVKDDNGSDEYEYPSDMSSKTDSLEASQVKTYELVPTRSGVFWIGNSSGFSCHFPIRSRHKWMEGWQK